MNYKTPEIYDAGGDLKKQWFVFYSFKNPETNRFERIKVFKDINSFKTKSERYERMNVYKVAYRRWLESGGSPFELSLKSDADKEQNILNCIKLFGTFLDNSKLRKNTKDKYKGELAAFEAWLIEKRLDGVRIGQIKKQHIFEFIETIRARPTITSGKTVNHYLDDLRRFFNHFIDNYDDFLERNPAAKITRDTFQTKGNVAFTEQEFETVRTYLLENYPYMWFVCQVIYYTGLRNEAEALELRCGDFDFDKKVFYVESWVAKNKIRQSVPMYPEFIELLQEKKIADYPSHWFLFGKKDQPGELRVGWHTFSKRFNKIKNKLGFGDGIGIYCFKSTRACHLYDDGAAIRDIQLLFRHQTPLITMEYLKTLGRVERERILDKGRKI